MSLDDLKAGLQELRDSRGDYDKAEEYYDGAQPEVFASIRMRQLLARAGISYRVNFCKLPVTVLADRLKITAVTASTPEAQAVVDRVWRANRMNLLTKNLHRKVGMYGDGYLYVWPNADNTEVQIRYNSPLTMRVIHDPADEDTPLYYIKRWQAEPKLLRADLIYRDRIERWASKDKGRRWQPYVDPDDGEAEAENPYDAFPVFHFRTSAPYGVPDHIDAYGPQDAINKLIAVQMGNVDFYGFPQRAALTESGGDEMDREDLWDDEEDGPSQDNDGQAATIQSSPERAWLLRNVRQLVQLPQADPQVFIAPFLLLVRAMAQVTQTPVRHMDPQGDVPSGESQRASDAPLIKRTEDRQEILDPQHQDMWGFIFKVNATLDRDDNSDESVGVDVGRATVDIRWEPPEQTDDIDEWQVAKAKLDAGVPPRVVLVEAGYAPEQVEAWIEEAPAIELMPRVELLVKIAQAAQGLGASSALGVIDPGLVQRAIAAITGGVDGGEAA